MNSSGLPDILQAGSFQAAVDQIVRDVSKPAFDSSGGIPSRTTAYKGYSQTEKSQREHQQKPQKKTPHVIIEK